MLLAPLDPLIYDRRLTSALWNFEYTWEVYTPPAKRKRGYYALPAEPKIRAISCPNCGSSVQLRGMGSSLRSEERRVGKECGVMCRSRWSPYH